MKARIDRFVDALRISELDGRMYLRKLRDRLENAAHEALPTAANKRLEETAGHADQLWSNWR
jgi:hypothetical protein